MSEAAVWKSILITPETRTGLLAWEFHFAREHLKRLIDPEGPILRREEYMREELAREIGRMTGDGRAYVVRWKQLVSEPWREIGIDGSPEVRELGLHMRLEVAVLLARLADAQMGEFVWDEAVREVEGLSTRDPHRWAMNEVLCCAAFPDRPGLYCSLLGNLNTYRFRRVPLGWEREA